MECTFCHKAMKSGEAPVGEHSVGYAYCETCDIVFVPAGDRSHILEQLPDGQPDTCKCPHCRDHFLETADIPVRGEHEARACHQCGGLLLACGSYMLNHGLSLETSPLGQFLTGVGLLRRDSRKRRRDHQLPGSFRVENARPTDLKCPHCHQALTLYRVQDQKRSEGADFEICDHCFGIWLDRDDLREARGQREHTVLEVDFESIQPARRTCPKCRDMALFAMKFKSPRTEIDCCPACFGTWLDGGELREFCHHLKGDDHGVIDTLIDNAVFQQPALCKTLLHYSQTLFQLDEQVASQNRNLDQARSIQSRLLFGDKEVTHLPNWTYGGWNISGFWESASEVGGDYFDLIPMQIEGRDQLWMCIADVSGKGLPASLLMANFQALLRSFAPGCQSPASLCQILNSTLYQNTTSSKYITAFVALLDLSDGTLRYTNAGHNPPLLLGDQKESWLSTGGTVLGLLPDWDYTQQELVMGSEDILLLYTDGVSEAEDQNGVDLGEQRLVKWVVQHKQGSLEETLHQLVRDLRAWCLGEFGDDATMLLVGRDRKR